MSNSGPDAVGDGSHSPEDLALIPPYGLPDDDGQRDYWDELTKQTDRGAAVLAASHLEWRVRESIKIRFDIWDGHVTKLFGKGAKGGDLGFSDQRRIAYGLALIGPVAFVDLGLIGQIRNVFAHNPSVRSFDHKLVSDLVKELQTTDVLAQRIEAATRHIPEVGEVHKPADRRDKYIKTAHHISIGLWLAGRHYALLGKKYNFPHAGNFPYDYW